MATTHIAKTGNDSSDGTSLGNAWLTVLRMTGQSAGGGTIADDGDTSYVYNGTYDSGTTPTDEEGPAAYNPTQSGSSGSLINYRVFPGHVVRLQCTTRADTQNPTPVFGCGSSGAANRDFVLWDGFRVVEGGTYKMAFISGEGNILENLYMDVGPRTNGTTNGNYPGVWIHNSDTCIVRYCDVRESYDTVEAGTGQCYGILAWDSTSLRVHNNDIRNCSEGVEDKRDCTSDIWELNFITGSDKHAILISDLGGSITATSCTIRYNVASFWSETVSGSGFIKSNWSTGNTDLHFYNNTGYGGDRGFFTGAAAGASMRVYNNIIVPSNTNACQYFEGVATPADYRCDFNRYFTTSGETTNLFATSAGNRTITQWQAITGESSRTLDTHGAAADSTAVGNPTFATATPTESTPVTGFMLGGGSACSNAGHETGLEGGATVNIGAYYTSDVTVGIPGQSVTGVWIV